MCLKLLDCGVLSFIEKGPCTRYVVKQLKRDPEDSVLLLLGSSLPSELVSMLKCVEAD